MKRLIIQIVLAAISAVLIYMVYESIQQPVRYDSTKEIRKQVIVQKLNEIKALQVEFKKVHGKYTGSFDTLIDFYKTGKIAFVMKIGSNDTMSEAQALKLKLIRRDTSYINVKDSLFQDIENFNIENLAIVPFTGGKIKFEMEAGTVEKASYILPVFEVRCYMKDFLKDVDQQELLTNEIRKMKKDEKFAGWKLGSLTEVSIDGNW